MRNATSLTILGFLLGLLLLLPLGLSAQVSKGLKLTVSPSSATVNTPADIRLENTGTEVLTITSVTVTRPNGSVDTIPGFSNITLKAGESKTERYTNTGLVGTYTVKATFDSAGLTETFQRSSPPPPPPSFRVSVSAAPSSPCAGETVTITISVRNVGNGSGTADLELRIDGSLRRSWSLSLAPGGSTTVSESTSFSSGSHTVEARVFWQGTQHDADRTSVNARSGTFFAVGPLDAPRRVSPNQSFTVSTTISNTGCSSGTQTIRFLVDGSQRDSTRVSLSAGGSTTVSFRWSFSSKGSYRVTIASDDDSSSTTIAVNGTPDPADDGQAGVLLPPIRGIQDTAALQQLIEAAKPGETLVLPSGIYQGTLVIRGKQGITLDGAGAVTLIGNGRDPVISIFSSQSVQIVGLTITRAYPAILVWKSEEVTIKGNTLMHNPGPGIDSQGSTIFISENTIRDNDSWGIVIRSYPKASKAVITGNMLARNRSVGVIIFGGGSTEVEIRDNQIFETKLSFNGQWGRGIEIQSAKATIVNNLIQGHPDTGVIAFNSIIELVGNTITATRGFYGRGVELQKSEAMLIRNTITNNEDIGLAVFASSKVRLQANVIHDNGYDLFADEQSTIEWEEGS